MLSGPLVGTIDCCARIRVADTRDKTTVTFACAEG